MHICICQGSLKKIDVSDIKIQFIYSSTHYRNANIVNFVYYGKTRIKQ